MQPLPLYPPLRKAMTLLHICVPGEAHGEVPHLIPAICLTTTQFFSSPVPALPKLISALQGVTYVS